MSLSSTPLRLGILSSHVGMEHFPKGLLEGLNITLLGLGNSVSSAEEVTKEADICIADANLFSEYVSEQNGLEKMKNLKWVQFTFAGIENAMKTLDPFIKEEKIDFRITRLRGSFSQQMAEFSLAHMVNKERGVFKMKDFQRKSEWCKDHVKQFAPLCRKSLVVLGVGQIGKEIARLASVGYRMKVTGVVNNAERYEGKSTEEIVKETFCSEIHGITELSRVLSDTDFIVSVLPSTPATRYLLDKENLLENCKRKPFFINVGRGDVISESRLVSAIENGLLSGAALDVLEEEPLPSSSKLWKHPDIFISPHVSGMTFPEDVVTCFHENALNFLKGGPMETEVDLQAGY
eukprot:Nk52_evm10s359 gene=Nk52_evmTU10s359